MLQDTWEWNDFAQLVGAVEYTDYTSAEELRLQQVPRIWH